MNSKFHAQRTDILNQMAALETMEQGSLKSELRDQPSGGKSGPYFKHQVWRDGVNVSKRISPQDAPELITAIANRQKFEALAATFIELTIAHTRQNQFPDSLKKKGSTCLLAQEEEISQIMARFSSEAPTGTAVQELEVLVRTALFKPAAAIVGCLIQQAAQRIDLHYQPKPGEERKGRESLQVQCLFGTFELQRDYYYHPGKKYGHYPSDAALGLEGSYTPGLARLICLEGADESTYLKAERHLEQTGGILVSARQIQRVVQRVGSAAQQWQQRPAQPGSCDAPIMYVSADGTGVPMVPEELSGRPGKQADGTAKTRQVYLGCVFTQHKTDEKGHPVRDWDSTTYVSSFQPIDEFGPGLRQEAIRRGMGEAGEVVLLIDGAAGLENMGKQHFKDSVQVVDFYHAMEHAGKVLEALIGKSHSDYKKRQHRWATRLLKDKVAVLIKETRQECAGQPQEQAVEEALGYFVRNISRMQYGTFRQAGYFIGSGVVEAGCKTVIGGRCKQSGMFWSKSGAENILALRCIHSSRRLGEFWKYRLNTQAALNDSLPFAA